MFKHTKLVKAAAVAFGLTAVLATTGAQAADMGAKDEPIKLAMHEWTGQHITTHIAGKTLG